MENVIVGYCPYCGGAGHLHPAHEQNSSDVILVCDECLTVFESIKDLQSRKGRALKSRYVELTMLQAVQSGLGEYLMKFDGNKQISHMGDDKPIPEKVPSEKSLSHLKDLEVIREHLYGTGLRKNVVDAIMKNFERYEDIAFEFAYRIRYGQVCEPCITVRIENDIFSADSLMKDYKRIATLHDAYSYLAFLRDDSDSAINMLKRGLPVK